MLVDNDKLKGLIRRNGYTYKTLEAEAKRKGLGLNQSTISNVANGTHSPSYQTIHALYELLDMTSEDVVEIFLQSKKEAK